MAMARGRLARGRIDGSVQGGGVRAFRPFPLLAKKYLEGTRVWVDGRRGPPWPLDTSHTNRLGQELPESVCAAPVTRRGGRLLQQLNKGQLLLSLNIPYCIQCFQKRARVCPDFLPGPHPGLSTICAQGTTYLPTYPYMEGGYKTTS